MQIVIFCANLRKFDLFGLIEEDLDYQNSLKPLRTVADHKSNLPSKLINFWYKISLMMFIKIQKPIYNNFKYGY